MIREEWLLSSFIGFRELDLVVYDKSSKFELYDRKSSSSVTQRTEKKLDQILASPSP